jgi:hypothetical protein
MTLKQEYIKIRNSNTLDINFLYKYYLENCKSNPVDLSTFVKVMQFGNPNDLYSALDKSYNLTAIFNKEGVFLKVIE